MDFRVRLRIRGRVQGVFYRKTAEDQANALGLSGWVRNMSDGSVEAFAVGPKEKLLTYIAWCRVGPTHACVDSVEEFWKEPESAAAGDEDVYPGSGFTVRGW
jgi:acylphosphatase